MRQVSYTVRIQQPFESFVGKIEMRELAAFLPGTCDLFFRSSVEEIKRKAKEKFSCAVIVGVHIINREVRK